MIDLNRIISTFSLEEKQKFVAYLTQKNKRKDAKNIKLFKLISKGELDSKALSVSLYGKEKSNAYHALRKRLYEAIVDFTANEQLTDEHSTEMTLIKYILSARSFLQQQQYQIAFKILDKAEKTAKAQQLFPYLNEIYQTQIQYAHYIPELDLDLLIKKAEHNAHLKKQEDQLNTIYARVRQTLNAITYQGKVIDLEAILIQNFNDYQEHFMKQLSFKSLYQLVRMASIFAFATKNYLNIESFLLKTYQHLTSRETTKEQLVYHIEVLYQIANTLFRNKKFLESLNYLELMKAEMLKKNKKNYHNYKLKYRLLQCLNLNYTKQQDQAIKILEQNYQVKTADYESILDIHLCLITCYVQQQAFKKALAVFAKFHHSDQWYTQKAGKEWVLKKNIIEIILHIELGHTDLVESRFRSFKRQHYKYLKENNQDRVIKFLRFVESYYKTPETITSNQFKSKVEDTFEWIDAKQEDIFVMSFYAWLKSKMEQKDLYECTLELIEKARER